MRKLTPTQKAQDLINKFKLSYTTHEAEIIAKRSAIMYCELQLEEPQSITSTLYWKDVLNTLTK